MSLQKKHDVLLSKLQDIAGLTFEDRCETETNSMRMTERVAPSTHCLSIDPRKSLQGADVRHITIDSASNQELTYIFTVFPLLLVLPHRTIEAK